MKNKAIQLNLQYGGSFRIYCNCLKTLFLLQNDDGSDFHYIFLLIQFINSES